MLSLKSKSGWLGRSRILGVVVFFVSGLCLTGLIVSRFVDNLNAETDYNLHASLLKGMIETGTITVPHFLAHLLAAAVSNILGITLQAALGWVTAAGLATTIAISYWNYSETFPRRAVLGTIALALFHPILFYHQQYYLGSIALTTFHNPTYALLKPLALLHFVLVSNAVNRRCSWTVVGISALVLVVSALAKPSYAVCLVPAASFYAFVRILQRKPVNGRLIAIGIVLPAILVLGWQYYFTFVTQPTEMDKSSIILAPLAALEQRVGHIAQRFILSVAFPATVIALYWRRALARTDVLLALLVFLMGAAGYYLLAETGARMSHLNFAWGAYIGLFILVFVLIRFLLDEFKHGEHPSSRWRLISCCIVLAIHVVSGVIWFSSEYLQPGKHW